MAVELSRKGFMTCQEYLALYSDYLDERLGAAARTRCTAHAEACRSCARYDRVMRRGLQLARSLPEIVPSSDFDQRLQHRIFHVQDDLARTDRLGASGALVALALAGVIALAAWSPVLTRGVGPEVERAASGVTEPAASDARTDRVDTPPWWYGGTAGGVFSFTAMDPTSIATLSDLAAAFPGPYSPLIVSPPVTRGVGSTLARYNE